MEEIDIGYYSKWPLKVENEVLSRQSEEGRSPVNSGMPTRTTINTTNSCNLVCNMCRYHGQEKIPSEILEYQDFIKVGEQLFPFVKELHAAVKGEPLLTTYFDGMIDIIDFYGVKLNLTTNGMLLTPKKSELIIPVLRDVKVSFDGAKKETFEKIRNGSNYDKIVGNIKDFVRLRDQYVSANNNIDGFYRPTLTIQSVLMTDNIEEIPEIVRIAHDLGADRVKGFNLMVNNPDYLSKSLLFDQKRANKYLNQAIEIADSLGLQTKYQDLFDGDIDIFNYRDDKSGRRDCLFLWRQITVDPNGDVRPCCHDKSPVMGNVHKDNVKDIWNNEIYKDMRAKLGSENPYDCCKHCAMLSRKVLDAHALIFCNIDSHE